MMNTVKVLGFTALLFVLAIALAMTLMSKQVVSVVTEQSIQPDSATDVIMRSRKTVASDLQGSHDNYLMGAGLLAIFLLSSGVAFFLMRGGTELSRQLRLLRKKPKRHPKQQIPYITEWAERPIPYLQEVNDEHSFDTPD